MQGHLTIILLRYTVSKYYFKKILVDSQMTDFLTSSQKGYCLSAHQMATKLKKKLDEDQGDLEDPAGQWPLLPTAPPPSLSMV